jgi:hypothetical protein
VSTTPRQKLKAKSRRYVRTLELKLERLQAERDQFESVALHANRAHRTLEQENERQHHIVRHIVRTILESNPASALVPVGMHGHHGIGPDDTRAHIRSRLSARLIDTCETLACSPMEFEDLIDLRMQIEELDPHFDTLMRVALIDHRAAQKHCVWVKFSRTMLRQLTGTRERFCRDIGNELAAGLYEHLKKQEAKP